MHASSGDRRILRASDADRDAVVEQLRHHGAVGRLRLDELTSRIETALEARTLGDLDALLADLPADAPLARRAEAALEDAPVPTWRSPAVLARAAQLLVVNVVFFLLWSASGDHGGHAPVFLLLVSLALLARRVSRVAARAERDRRRAARTKTPPPHLPS